MERTAPSKVRRDQTHLCHQPPMNPANGFWSAKLALRAELDTSVELRFWLTRPANLPDEVDDWISTMSACAHNPPTKASEWHKAGRKKNDIDGREVRERVDA